MAARSASISTESPLHWSNRSQRRQPTPAAKGRGLPPLSATRGVLPPLPTGHVSVTPYSPHPSKPGRNATVVTVTFVAGPKPSYFDPLPRGVAGLAFLSIVFLAARTSARSNNAANAVCARRSASRDRKKRDAA